MNDGGARHLIAKALHRAALEIPGATIASVTWVTVLLAVSTALALGSLLRRSHALTGLAGPASLAAAGLLVASPAFGLVWLHGERLGLVLAPLLLLIALGWLQGTSRPALRQLGALALVAAAPFCHTHGLLVGAALLPAIVGAARTAGSRRVAGWVGAALVLSLAAGWYSVQPLAAQGLSAGGGIFAVLPFAAFLRELSMHAGSAWLDLLPSTELDELVLGALSWVAPLVLLFVGDRSAAARARTAPWWSCVLFGLGVVLWNVLRYDAEPPVGRWREAMFGVFLLPVGLVGVVAGRFGGSALRVAFGALLVLAAQDWWLGLEDVRIARSLTQQQDAAATVGGGVDHDAAADAGWARRRRRERTARARSGAGADAASRRSARRRVPDGVDRRRAEPGPGGHRAHAARRNCAVRCARRRRCWCCWWCSSATRLRGWSRPRLRTSARTGERCPGRSGCRKRSSNGSAGLWAAMSWRSGCWPRRCSSCRCRAASWCAMGFSRQRARSAEQLVRGARSFAVRRTPHSNRACRAMRLRMMSMRSSCPRAGKRS